MTDLYHKTKTLFWDTLHAIHPSLHALAFRFRTLIKYLFSGSMGAVANLGSLAILVEVFRMHYLPASMLSFLFGFITSFTLQKFFTFGDTTTKALHRQLAVYFFIATINLGLNTLLVFIFTERVGLWYFFSQLTAGVLIACWSFFLYRTFVFRKGDYKPLSRSFKVVALSLAVVVAVLYIPSFIHTVKLSQEQEKNGVTMPLPVYGSDSVGFTILADTLRESGNLGYFPGHKDTFRTPGYPMLLAGWKSITGSYDFFPLVQIFLVYLTALLVFCIGKKFFSVTVGVISVGLLVINPNTVYHSLVLLSEVPHMFFLVLSAYLVIVKPRLYFNSFFLAGVALGFATLIKPVSLYLPLVFALFFFLEEKYVNRSPVWFSRAVLSALVFILAFIAVLTPWLLRNYRVSGVLGVSSVSAFNLFHYTVPEFLSYREGITPDEGRELLRVETSIPPEELSNLSHSSEIQSIALSYIAQDPVRFAGFYTVKSIPFFLSSSLDNLFVTYNDVSGKKVFSPSTANLTNLLLSRDVGAIFRELKAHPAVAVEQVLLGLLFLFSLAGVVLYRKNVGVWFLFFLVAYFATVTGVVAYARLRIPAEPFLFILAVVGFSVSMRLIWTRKQRLTKLSPLSSPPLMKK